MRYIKCVLMILAAVVFYAHALEVGQSAPDFSDTTFSGETFHLAGQRGKVVVLVTIGCT